MNWDDLSGQEAAKALLQAALKSDHIGHAYLFHGPAGVGKTKAALVFAKALLCERPCGDGEACGACASCRAADALRHPDLELLTPLPTFRVEGRTERQAEEARSEARAQVLARAASGALFSPVFSRPPVHSVEDLARAKQFLALTPQREGGRKVLIVKHAEAMTPPAAHAFLKILEEPQVGRVLILGARQVRGLLPTIASRCLHVRFRPLDPEFIATALVASRGISKPAARVLGATAQGSLGRALALVDAPLDTTAKEAPGEAEFARIRSAAIDLFVRPKGPAVLGPLRRARLERDRGRFLAAVSLALYYYRDVIRSQVIGDGAVLSHEDLKREIRADAGSIALATLTSRVRILEEIAASVQSNVTAAYAVASAQRRMGLWAAPASGLGQAAAAGQIAGGPARAGVRHG
jgi:DNA polymerase III delta' subunit